MLKIRKDNQFTWAWAITRDGQAIDLTTATNLKYKYQIKDQSGRVDILSYTKTGNIISTVFLPTQPGIYNLLLTFDLPADGPCAVDVDAFEIVKSSEEASDASEFTVTSEMAIGFTGKNAYEVWLETHEGTLAEYEAWLKQPAADAAASVQTVEQAVEVAESLRLTSEQGRETAEGLRVAAEDVRQGNEQTRQDAEDSRDAAETNRGNNEAARQTKETERQQAETTRGNNETARISAETTRVNNEATRQTKETERQQAETTRGNNETARTSAETTRGQNETTRQTKETERQNAEEARQLAGYITSPSAMQIAQLTQAQYDALPVKVATTIYLIIQV